MFEIAQSTLETPGAKICVIGVGGGGGNVIKTMLGDNLQGVEFIVANTDRQALDSNPSSSKIYLGKSITKGLGAGANPEVGEQSALESEEEIKDMLAGHDMLFITAGMGGGTGTGAVPIIARIAKELGILTVGVVTKPFIFEGKKRTKNAERGIELLKSNVDTLIVIPNQKLLTIANEKTPLLETFRKADSVLLQAVKSISDLINVEGLINLDFADIKTVMQSRGVALMGSGVGSGESRAVEAAQAAIKSPLLENVSIDGATGVIINITGNSNLTLWEVNEAASLISNAADESAEIIFGSVIDENVKDDEIFVTVVATGFQEKDHSISYNTHSYAAATAASSPNNHNNTNIENMAQNFAKAKLASTPLNPTEEMPKANFSKSPAEEMPGANSSFPPNSSAKEGGKVQVDPTIEKAVENNATSEEKVNARELLLEKAKSFDIEASGASHLNSKEQLSMNLDDDKENHPIDIVKDIAKKVVKSPFKTGLDWASFKKKWVDLDK
ncbi:MAG: cell division protein FtsZ [Bdellovibrionaceae bacterium]|nr:cell division protein FtsZ [Pseudobdellovibrionaceae bacterium]